MYNTLQNTVYITVKDTAEQQQYTMCNTTRSSESDGRSNVTDSLDRPDCTDCTDCPDCPDCSDSLYYLE